eukprot:5664073-Amphidinium_carterae.1
MRAHRRLRGKSQVILGRQPSPRLTIGDAKPVTRLPSHAQGKLGVGTFSAAGEVEHCVQIEEPY